VALGMVCCECKEPFTKGHGEVVACAFCHRRMSGEERAAIPRATHPEATNEAFAKINRKRKQRREAEGILTPEGLQVYHTKNPTENDE
jgi:uncharacterized Zn finger protein (UPF0148 family)